MFSLVALRGGPVATVACLSQYRMSVAVPNLFKLLCVCVALCLAIKSFYQKQKACCFYLSVFCALCRHQFCLCVNWRSEKPTIAVSFYITRRNKNIEQLQKVFGSLLLSLLRPPHPHIFSVCLFLIFDIKKLPPLVKLFVTLFTVIKLAVFIVVSSLCEVGMIL